MNVNVRVTGRHQLSYDIERDIFPGGKFAKTRRQKIHELSIPALRPRNRHIPARRATAISSFVSDRLVFSRDIPGDADTQIPALNGNFWDPAETRPLIKKVAAAFGRLLRTLRD